MKTLLGLALIFMTLSAFSSIYEWTDSHGNVSFSDTPRKGSKKLDLPDAQSYSAPQTQMPTTPANDKETVDSTPYSSVAITTPVNDSTIPNQEGLVNVSVDTVPTLRKEDNIQLLLDGKPVGKPQKSTIFTINNVYRGTHTLSLNIISDNGSVLISSEKITFFVHRPTKLLSPAFKK